MRHMTGIALISTGKSAGVGSLFLAAIFAMGLGVASADEIREFAGKRVAADAQSDALVQRGSQFVTQQNYAQALPLLLESAKRGNSRAQALLGNMYGDGRGVPQDFGQAMEWYRKAAEQGHRFAQYSLGLGYMTGLGGLPEDDAKAARLYDASARQGLPEAQAELGIAYEFGFGVPRNRQTAIYWLDQAARQGHGRARWIVEWLRRADTPNFANMVKLDNYINGIVITENNRKALSGSDQAFRDYIQRGHEIFNMGDSGARAACAQKTSGAHC
jgi:TPR repeat protein